jgi:xylulokinase
MSHSVLGIDLGTSSLKCVLMDGDGRVRGSASCPYPTSRPQPGWAEQNPADWCEALAHAFGELRARAPSAFADIGAIGLCSAAHIPVLLDAKDAVVRPAILWSDQRSEAQVQALNAGHGAQLERVALNRAGCTWTLPQLVWLRDCEPENHSRARSVLCSKDYLLWKLTGIKATDPASAAATLMADVPARRWSEALTGLAGLSADMLPPILPTDAEAGRVSAAAAREFGLPAGIPVFVGTLDSAAELIGCGVCEPQNTGMIMVGSSGGIMALAHAPSHHAGIITYPYVVDDFYYKQAGTNSCATSLQWIRTLFSTVPGQVAALGFSELDELAAQTDAGAGGLLFHPYLQGERAPYWNPELRGSFCGIDQTHTSGHFVRAVMEGVAYSLKDCLAMFERNGLTMKSAVIAGGVAKSPVWTRIITDVLGLDTYTTHNGESAFGAALLAATAKGIFADLKEAVATCVRREHTLAPDPQTAARYAACFARYQAVAAFYDSLCRAA